MNLRQIVALIVARLERRYRTEKLETTKSVVAVDDLINLPAEDKSNANWAIALSQRLQKHGMPLNAVEAGDDWCLSTDPHARTLEPFIFMHIPKTAGSVMRLVIMSLFDQERIYPGVNYPDYDSYNGNMRSAINPEQHGVFVGPMYWDAINCIESIVRRRANIFTILRRPIDHFRSQISFIDKQAEGGTTRTVLYGKEFDFVKFWNGEARIKYGGALINTQISSILAAPPTRFAPRRRNRFRRKPNTLLLVRRSLEAGSLLGRGNATNRSILRSRLGRMHIGLAEELQMSLNLLCTKFDLPYQPLPDVRLNSSSVDHTKSLVPRMKREIRKNCKMSFDCDADERARFYDDYERAFGNVADIRYHLNEQYRLALLPKLKRHWCMSLRADRAWPGFGWSYRDGNEHGQTWRQLGPNGRATIIMRLHDGCDYLAALTVHSCEESELFTLIKANANRTSLKKVGYGYRGSNYIIKWTIPASIVSESNGCVDLEFELAAHKKGRQPIFSISAVEAYPAI